MHFDAREISVIHDLQDMYQGSLQLRTAAYTDDGRSTVPMMTASKIAMRPAEYRYGMEHGLRLSFQITLPSPGAWQIRAVVADGTSDRIGSAAQFVEIPNVKLGSLAMSGLVLRGNTPAPNAPADPNATRITYFQRVGVHSRPRCSRRYKAVRWRSTRAFSPRGALCLTGNPSASLLGKYRQTLAARLPGNSIRSRSWRPVTIFCK